MTIAEQRITDFTSGINALGDDSRQYLHRITHALFMVEQQAVGSGFDSLPMGEGDWSMPEDGRKGRMR